MIINTGKVQLGLSIFWKLTEFGFNEINPLSGHGLIGMESGLFILLNPPRNDPGGGFFG